MESHRARPPGLAVGIGCKRGVSAEAIETAVHIALRSSGLAFADIACVASIDIKQDEAGLRAFCERHRLPLSFYGADDIAPTLLDGVCEPCALLASDGGRLAVRKTIAGGVTVAIAVNEA
ncbi:cobalamin biosynthesis protein [Caballeronia sp. Lep1P3]|uniref:cobalamin biosynthesis protein n=1 Tax=Caballeronia sp. Lep1P3 TaxID=2878150 RepID=UPI001FD2D3AD|nr:cobalamin biosynthesis protein [Caballeronia sp. Lep1P3]